MKEIRKLLIIRHEKTKAAKIEAEQVIELFRSVEGVEIKNEVSELMIEMILYKYAGVPKHICVDDFKDLAKDIVEAVNGKDK